ncbi:MAG: glycosyltransferase 87 family protein [Dehalococcoidia bacterium]|jgi:Gpi18-like mannosyltransferase
MRLLTTTRRTIRDHLPLIALLVVAIAIRLPLLPLWAYQDKGFTDEGFWKNWMVAIHQHGLLNIFRTTDTDYVGYHYVLWLLARINGIIGGSWDYSAFRLRLLVKAPPVLFDLGLIVAVYAVSRALFEELRLPRSNVLALIAAAVMAVQPAVLYDSAVWSQTDSAVTLAMLLALFFVARGNIKLGFGIWGVGFLIKPHPIVILPLLIYLAWRQSPRALRSGVVTVAAVWLIGLGPWLVHGDLLNILRVYRGLFEADYDRLSASAWNLWWFADLSLHPHPDQGIIPFITYRTIGLVLTVSAGFLALFYLHARPNLRGALVAAAYLSFAFYLLPISTHDRYLYPFLAFMLPIAVAEPRWRALYGLASVAFFFNLAVVAPPIADFAGRWTGSPFTIAVAALNCLLFALFTVALVPIAAQSARTLLLRGRAGARAALRGAAGEAN